MNYFNAFWVGGLICLIGQILIDKTKLTPARILTGYVVTGIILTAVGIYEPVVEYAGAGATVPLLGFGYAMAKGVEKAVAADGLIGAFTGGLSSAAGGIAAAVFFSLIAAFIFKPKTK
ncbi:MAG: stage V sporulation protein AE [Clostridia bacterium]|nr:stage V sporulation protein AE [Clostridia bacterium]MBR5266013.1 stage V sporulation protein AE [Clostridia bacterium]